MRWTAALSLLAIVGCTDRSLHDSSASDLAMLAPADLAPPAADLSGICGLASENASVVYSGQSPPYAWFANRPGPVDCERYGQVLVILGAMPSTPPELQEEFGPTATFMLVEPQQLGTQTIDVTTNIGANTTVSATLELTDFTVDPVQAAVVSVAGRLQAADGSWQGSFTAARCSLFEGVCI